MTGIDFTRNGIRYRQLWGNEAGSLSAVESQGIDILEFRESYVELPGLSPFRDGVVDLSAGVSAAYEKFEKGFKYEVRRAEKDGFVCRRVEEISEPILEAYYVFSEQKKIHSIGKFLIDLYRQHNVLFVSAASLNETTIQYHLYFVMDKEIVLLASFPAPGAHDIKKTAIGFANRFLHWFDVQYAAQLGKQFYNLGGIGNNAEITDTQGIVKFKMEMTPESRNYYHGSIALSLKGKMYTMAKKIMNKNA